MLLNSGFRQFGKVSETVNSASARLLVRSGNPRRTLFGGNIKRCQHVGGGSSRRLAESSEDFVGARKVKPANNKPV